LFSSIISPNEIDIRGALSGGYSSLYESPVLNLDIHLFRREVFLKKTSIFDMHFTWNSKDLSEYHFYGKLLEVKCHWFNFLYQFPVRWGYEIGDFIYDSNKAFLRISPAALHLQLRLFWMIDIGIAPVMFNNSIAKPEWGLRVPVRMGIDSADYYTRFRTRTHVSTTYTFYNLPDIEGYEWIIKIEMGTRIWGKNYTTNYGEIFIGFSREDAVLKQNSSIFYRFIETKIYTGLKISLY